MKYFYLTGIIVSFLLLKINKYEISFKKTLIASAFSWITVLLVFRDTYIKLLNKFLGKIENKLNPITFVFINTILHGQFKRKHFVKNMFSYRYYHREKDGVMKKYFHKDDCGNSWQYLPQFLEFYYMQKYYNNKGWLVLFKKKVF